jgi:hypothetical protein
MTSPAKIRAHRRNPLRSTGPRSSGGRAIAARNARRHGLTVPVLDEPWMSEEVIALARRIETSVTYAADAAGHALACRIAEAMIDLDRGRSARSRRAGATLAPRSLRAHRARATQARDPRIRRAGRTHRGGDQGPARENRQNEANGETPVISAPAIPSLARSQLVARIERRGWARIG